MGQIKNIKLHIVTDIKTNTHNKQSEEARMAGAGKTEVDNITQDVPKFIRDFKAQTGQLGREQQPDINSKLRPVVENDNDDYGGVGKDSEKFVDEAPVVCAGKGVS